MIKRKGSSNENKTRVITLIISILAHILLFFILVLTHNLQIPLFFNQNPKKEPPEEKDTEIVFQVVDTPDEIKEDIPEKKEELYSDKSTKAKDKTPTDTNKDSPISEGNSEVIAYNNKQLTEAEKSKDIEQNKEVFKDIYNELKQDNQTFKEYFDKQKLIVNKYESYKNNDNSAKFDGAISFNTYKWDFAPYMLDLKKKIEQNIHPPYAFTHLGMISGKSLVRFKIMPNGELVDLELLDSKGHVSLSQTSLGAIKSSVPLKPLPSNFPEKYLEVTASFSYLIRNQDTE